MARQALFEGLVYDEREQLALVAFVGQDAHYVVDDNGFRRHIDSEYVDRQVLAIFTEQLQGNKGMAVEQAMTFLGKDDLMTKAALDAQIDNVDLDQIIAQGLPLQARNAMGMMGFKIIINIHGELVDFRQPHIMDNGE